MIKFDIEREFEGRRFSFCLLGNIIIQFVMECHHSICHPRFRGDPEERSFSKIHGISKKL